MGFEDAAVGGLGGSVLVAFRSVVLAALGSDLSLFLLLLLEVDFRVNIVCVLRAIKVSAVARDMI